MSQICKQGGIAALNSERTIPVVVGSILQETPVVKRFKLYPIEGYKLPPFSPGSHIMTYLKLQDRVIIRPYSLTGHPDSTDHYEIAIRLSERSNGGSIYWHHHIQIGDQLQISYPKNHFPLSHRAKHHVFYAAGIGITPFLSMMAELKSKGASFELHYASRSKEYCAFYDEILDQFPEQSHFYFSQSTEPKRLDPKHLLQHMIGTHIYLCGPESLIADFIHAANQFGYPKSSIHFERFTPPKPINRNSFEVEVEHTGTVIKVDHDQTLLEALLDHGFKVPYSCRVGSCGTCEVNVVEGEIDHYDSVLTEEQKRSQKVLLACVSRAATKKIKIRL
jgi:ferredoxin-NADP reductase